MAVRDRRAERNSSRNLPPVEVKISSEAFDELVAVLTAAGLYKPTDPRVEKIPMTGNPLVLLTRGPLKGVPVTGGRVLNCS